MKRSTDATKHNRPVTLSSYRRHPPKRGIDPAACLNLSYGRLFLAWKQQTNSPAENLTFDEILATAPV